jgi:hypothetical protein
METAGRETFIAAPKATTSPQHRRNHSSSRPAERSLMASACSSLSRTLQWLVAPASCSWRRLSCGCEGRIAALGS